MRPRLALVPGEPGGVGPELCVRLAQREQAAELIAIADPDTLRAAAAALGVGLVLKAPGERCQPGELAVMAQVQRVATRFGIADPDNAEAVIAALLRGASGCLAGEFAGLVTGPVNKASINAGGIAYTGTTELLAGHAGVEVVMMLANPSLRVALATTHLPLRAVPDAITAPDLSRCLRIVHASLQRQFGLAAPRIAVLGLNPHAGEAGLLGREEIDTIIPVLETLRAEGMQLIGPLPADTAFLPQKLAGFDAVLAMYHDQGLPVLKHAGFENAVNITLGLPYPRVAVDHGTALELAGHGVADVSSLQAAVDLCARLAQTGARA
jgi:4-hydroxythreonine-4-phosphate dehydrogenase